MEITVTSTVDIDLDEIIEQGELNPHSLTDEITDAICNYIDALDDNEYYLFGREERQQIFNAIKDKLKQAAATKANDDFETALNKSVSNINDLVNDSCKFGIAFNQAFPMSVFMPFNKNGNMYQMKMEVSIKEIK